MIRLVVIAAILSMSVSVLAATSKKSVPPPKELEKYPKSLFLVKKTKNNTEVGEPQIYPQDAQLRTLIYDKSLERVSDLEK